MPSSDLEEPKGTSSSSSSTLARRTSLSLSRPPWETDRALPSAVPTQAALETEDGPSSAELRGDARRGNNGSNHFPLDICCCLSQVPIVGLVPDTCRNIQDMLHLVLVGALCSSLLIIFTSIVDVYLGFWECFKAANLFCADFVFGLIFSFPIFNYSYGVINQYDEGLLEKQSQIRKEREAVVDAYKAVLSDMDTLLRKSTESAAGLAEKSFESKRRDFQRFLDRSKQQYGTSTVQDGDALNQFRRFCLNWFNIFKECSIDPVSLPKVVVTEEEMMRCNTLAELADLCSERLKVTEVRFMCARRDYDAVELKRRKKNLILKGEDINTYRRQDDDDEGSFATSVDDEPTSESLTNSNGPKSFNINSSSAPGQQNMSSDSLGVGSQEAMRRCIRPHDELGRRGWLKLSLVGFSCKYAENEAGYPMELNCGCIRMSLFSSQHLIILNSFLLGIIFAVLQFYRMSRENEDSRWGHVILIIIAEICVGVVLQNFEDIDTLAQLEMEVQELATQKKEAEQQQEKMREFWTSAQQLTDLWLHRTVPRLELCKELHYQLEESSGDDLVCDLLGANKGIEAIEAKLGSLEEWRIDGAIKDEDKKLFSKTINKICNESSMDHFVVALQELAHSQVIRNLTLADQPESSPRLPVKNEQSVKNDKAPAKAPAKNDKPAAKNDKLAAKNAAKNDKKGKK